MNIDVVERLNFFFNARFNNGPEKYRETMPFGENGGGHFLVGTLQDAALEITRLRSRIAELEGALKPLANEARGLEWRASQIIEVIGDTNWSVLQGRVNEAMGLLEPALSCHTAACKDSEADVKGKIDG